MAKRMAVVPFRSDSAFGVPPHQSSGHTELFDRLIWRFDTRLGTVAGHPNQPSHHVATPEAQILQRGAALQTYLTFTPNSRVI